MRRFFIFGLFRVFLSLSKKKSFTLKKEQHQNKIISLSLYIYIYLLLSSLEGLARGVADELDRAQGRRGAQS
jgi:hypothetical protein